MNRFIFVVVLCATLVGCSAHSIRLDDFEDAKINESRPREIKAETCGYLLGFIAFRARSQLIRLERRLKEAANGGAITNVRVKESWYWAVGTLLCTEVRATAYPRLP
ncbi:MAG: hypothetical protein ACHQ6T_15570 [Myxococcota bacterium]